MIRTVAAASFLALMIAGVALAQTDSAEFGRAGGDEIVMLFKQPGTLSGSFGFSTSPRSDVASRGLTGTLGGALVADRLWFFAAGQRDQSRQFVPMTTPAPTNINLSTLLGDRQTLGAFLGTGRESSGTLRFTGIVSSNSFFTAKIYSGRETVTPSALNAIHDIRPTP